MFGADATVFGGVSAVHAAVLLATGSPAVHAREVLGRCAPPPSIFDATPRTKFGAQFKTYERGDDNTPKCPRCREQHPDADGDTQEMLELATPREFQEEDSPSPGALYFVHLYCKICVESYLTSAGDAAGRYLQVQLISTSLPGYETDPRTAADD